MPWPVELKVFRDKFGSKEVDLGKVVFDGKLYDYAGLEQGEIDNAKDVLETPYVEPVGFNPKDGYGKHSTRTVTRLPRTSAHLLAVCNRTLLNGLYLSVDPFELLEE